MKISTKVTRVNQMKILSLITQK